MKKCRESSGWLGARVQGVVVGEKIMRFPRLFQVFSGWWGCFRVAIASHRFQGARSTLIAWRSIGHGDMGA